MLKNILAQMIANLLFQTNDVLRQLARIFRSNTLFGVADSYTTWYNNYLLANILREGGIQGVIVGQELRGTVMIATFRSRGHFASSRMRKVLAKYLGVQKIQIQINKKETRLYTVVFPIR